MKRFEKDKFAEARKNGKWQDVDFLLSDFCAYQIVFHFQSKGIMRNKLVYLDSTNRDKITDYTNQGKQYY